MNWMLLFSVVSKVTDYFKDPVGRQIGYVFHYNTNFKNLKDRAEKLKSTKERVQIDVDKAIINGEEIYQDVEAWLVRVHEVIKQAEQIVKDKEDKAKTRCFKGWCPNLKTRYQLSKKAKKQTRVAVETQEGGKFEIVSHRKPPQIIRPVRGFEAFESRASAFGNIMEALKDANVNLIGIYGMSGVGKTTLAKEVAFRVKEEGMFKSVVMVTVTHQVDVKNIQQEIAEKLDFKIGGEFIDVRAARLRDRIEGEEKILVILDDIWEAIKLEEVGISYGIENKGCKILMTSRNQNVFLEMDVHKDFRLQVLNNQEAWNLFQNTMGGFTDSSLQSIATEVAKRCLGLPILIVTVASALKGKEVYEWNDALEKLKRFDHEGIENRVYKALELSYNFLEPEEKSLFLLCGQLRPHNIRIQDLLKYSLGLGLLNQYGTLRSARDRLLKVISDLKRCCLLLEGKDDKAVKMHDVVHRFAINVAGNHHRVFAVAHGTRLEAWPEKDKLEGCTAISFPDCEKIPKFPEVFECPNLSSFVFYSTDSSVQIPDRLFNRMKELKLLGLSRVHLSPLPLSLQNLENLQTLCLNYCDLEGIAAIGELKKLQVLSFTGSTIIQLPKQLGDLTNLRLLDLSICQKLEVIPADVLSRLTRLEELYIGGSFVRWQEEGHTGTDSNASLGELKLLSNLAVIEIQVNDAKMWPNGMSFEKLDMFKIFIGENWSWSGKYETSKTLKLQTNTSIQLRRVKGLLKGAEDVYLDDMKDVKNILNDLDDQGFPEMKHLNVRNNPDIQFIMDCTSMYSSHAAFTKLESLTLDYLVSLDKICRGAIKEESFSRLRKLNVRNCDRLKNLFSLSMSRSLVNLEKVYVSSCKTMEEIVVKEARDNSGIDEAIELRQLCSLDLENLPQLLSFNPQLTVPSLAITTTSSTEIVPISEHETPVPLFDRKIILPNLEELKLTSLEVEKIWSKQLMEQSVCIQKLTTLIVDGCGNLSYIFTSSMIQSLVKLKKLEICDCKSMNKIIATPGGGLGEEAVDNILFPKLEWLKLKNLPKLISFCIANLIECPFLKVVEIERCGKLKTFISGFTSHNGERDLTLFDQKVAFPKLEKLHVKFMKLKMIWQNGYQANSLKELALENANEILKICESGDFQNLESLVVNNCSLLEEVFDDHIQVAPTQLRTLKLKSLPNLKHVWKWNEDADHDVSFEKLTSVTVSSCKNLKNLFPVFIAKNLPQLELLNISMCGLEYIVSNGNNIQTTTHFSFPRLKTLYLQKSKDLKSFYYGLHTLECPVLEKLEVYHCDKLKTFYPEEEEMQESEEQEDMEEIYENNRLATQVEQPLFHFGEVVPNLVELGLNYKDTSLRGRDKFPADIFGKLTNLQLQCFYDTTTNFPLHLLHKFQNVDKLVLKHCYFNEIVPSNTVWVREDALARIHFLALIFVPKMKHIWNQDCQADQLLQNLQSLEVVECDALKNLAPSSASFYNLTHLIVSRCQGLINLVTTPTAKGMVNLITMTIAWCKSLKEIVANEGDAIKSWCEVTFSKLTTLILLDLTSLTCFSSSANCIIKFPSLKNVILIRCPKMEVFGHGVISSPVLQKVHITFEMDKWRWTKDLNTTIEHLNADMVRFNGIPQLQLSEFPELKSVWHQKSIPANLFARLNKLTVDECEISSHAVPSYFLPFLNELEELEVRNCDALEEVFGPEWPDDNGRSWHLPMLDKLHLIDLPSLRKVWPEVPERFLDLKSLTWLKIQNCNSLRNVFTAGLCLGLVQLRKLEVTRCSMVEAIITDGIAEEGALNEIMLPHLNSITLHCLPRLTNLMSATGIVQCPNLEEISIAECPRTFVSVVLESLATDGFTKPKITFPELADLKLYSVGVEKILRKQPHQSIQQLTRLIVDGCGNLNFLFTFSVLQSIALLEKLEICDCQALAEVIATQRSGDGGMATARHIQLPKLEFLKLKNLPKLKSFCSGNLIEFPSLKVLQIESCSQMKTFVSDCTGAEVERSHEQGFTNCVLFDEKVAFPKLEKLHVKFMKRLKMIWQNGYQVNSLKVLALENANEKLKICESGDFQNLESLVVNNCSLLEEVFGDHIQVAPTQLRTLNLKNLPNLKHIWKWNDHAGDNVSFEKLTSVIVWGCTNLKNLFPFFIAKNLGQLELLNISNCGLEYIVSEGNSMQTTTHFSFPRLKTLYLSKSQDLKSFYHGLHTLECPVLEKLKVYHCERLNTFYPEQEEMRESKEQEEMKEINASNQPATQVEQLLLYFGEVMHNLVELGLNFKDTTLIGRDKFPADIFGKLTNLQLQCFYDTTSFPFHLPHKFQNVDKLVLRHCFWNEIFPSNLVGEHVNALARIRFLTLNFLPKMKHIWNEDCEPGQLLQNLQTLEVHFCDALKILAPSSTSFYNLTSLDVWRCQGLINLVTTSVAKEMVNLITMTVRECKSVTEIVASEGDASQSWCEVTFDKLTTLKLLYLTCFTCFSPSVSCIVKFPSLKNVIVTRCPRMKVFAGGVINSPLLQKVHITDEMDKWSWTKDLNTTIQHLHADKVGFRGMQHLQLSEVPELKSVWHQKSIPANLFTRLNKLVVKDYEISSHAVPSYFLPFLNELEELVVRNCDAVEEVFGPEWPDDNGRSGHLPMLDKLHLIDLPSLRKVWLEVPERFLDLKSLTWLKIQNCNSLRNVFTAGLCLGLVQLRKLEVTRCSMVEAIITDGIAEEGALNEIMLPHLNSITLHCLPRLTNLMSATGIVQCPNLEEISIAECPSTFVSVVLESLATDGFTKPKITFPELADLKLYSVGVEKISRKQPHQSIQQLTRLIVDGCGNLNCLFTFSVLQSIALLKKLEICDCQALAEVIATQRSGDGGMATASHIQLPKLEFLKLKNLPKLKSFCSGNLIEFPSLKIMQIESCSQMKTFVSDCTGAEVESSFEPRLPNSVLFDEKVAFPKLEKLHVKFMKKLKMIWQNGYQANSLKMLALENANEILKICESGDFQNLESLVVNNCSLLEEVFGDHIQVAPTQLRTLNLKSLPNLKHIWKWNDHAGDNVSFEKLTSVIVWGCTNLKNLFPFYIAKNLGQLELLNISNCGLEYIVSEGNNIQTTTHFSFPRLKTLYLFKSQDLKSFYHGLHTLECPVLEKLKVFHCDRLNTFYPEQEEMRESKEQEEMQEINASNRPATQPLFYFGEVIHNLVELGLNCKDTALIGRDKFPADIFDKLTKLQLQCFYDTTSSFPFHLLHKFQNVDGLMLRHCFWNEIVQSNPVGEHVNALARIRFLKLNFLPKMKHIWNQDCEPGQLLQNLQTLEVKNCDALKNLAPSSISFYNLTSLNVWKCEGLINLVTTSVVKEMVNLITMTVMECKSVTEIVASEGDASQSLCQITFNKLTTLKFLSLTSLTCFSPSVSCIIKFPSLKKVIVTQCPRMKVFAGGVINSPLLQKVHITDEMDKWSWTKDLNTTIQHLHADKVGFSGMQQFQLSEFPELKSVWHQKSIPANLFRRLNKLVVDEYEISSHAVPSYFLPFLSELEELEVRNCDAVEEVFGPEWPDDNGQSGHLPMLDKLHLIDLPRLRKVWPEVPERFLDLKSLTWLKIQNCSSLKNVLTAELFLCLVQLRKLEVKRCSMVETIITDGIAKEGAVNEIMFPHLNSITLDCLPRITNLVSGTGIVHCPNLEEITIAECPSTFVYVVLESLATDEFSKPKITFPQLADLKLYSVGVEKILRKQPHQSIQQLTRLIVDGCGNLNFLFTFSVLQSITLLEKLEICDCQALAEVIATQRSGDGGMATASHIQLPKLEFLKLKNLPKLKSFCSGNLIEFPSLMTLQIESCLQMKTFVSDCTVAEVESSPGPGLPNSVFFDGKVAFPKLEELHIEYMNKVKMIWHNGFQINSLKVLKLIHANEMLKICESGDFQSLELLVVNNCDLLEVVFDGNFQFAPTQLRTLKLNHLPNLKHVWKWDDNSAQTIIFEKLHSINVMNCGSLKSLFPILIARNLRQLEVLDISFCGLEYIVSNEENTHKTADFAFPRLKVMRLSELQDLKSFYFDIHTLRCPMLQTLMLYHCDRLKIFYPEQQETQETDVNSPPTTQVQQPFFSFKEVMPNLIELGLNSKDTATFAQDQFPAFLFDKLKTLSLQCFYDTMENFPFHVLHKFQSVTELTLRHCHFKEIFTSIAGEHANELARICSLRLDLLPEMRYLWNKDCEAGQVLQNLQSLYVQACDALINLAPSFTSFDNLITLDVRSCETLINLVPTSTAKGMVNLTTMIVSECKSMTEIVANEGDDCQSSCEVMFYKLRKLELHGLYSLACFSPSASCIIKFPSLEEVTVTRCPEMKVFSQGVVKSPRLEKVNITKVKDKWRWTKDLNTTIQHLYAETNPGTSVQESSE